MRLTVENAVSADEKNEDKNRRINNTNNLMNVTVGSIDSRGGISLLSAPVCAKNDIILK